MSERPKKMLPPSLTSSKVRRPSTANVSYTSVTSARTPISRPRSNKKVIASSSEVDSTINKQESTLPDFDSINRQVAYGKFLRAMLEECLVDEKIEREETQMDIQMALLADRFQKTTELLDKTSKRLKDVSFVVEQKRLLDIKNHQTSQFYDITEKSNIKDTVNDLCITEEAYLNNLDTKNIDFGYDRNSGHKQLLDAVNDAISGLEDIKKHSALDIDKFEAYEKSHKNIELLENDKFNLETLQTDFLIKFPKLSEKLLKEASSKIAKIINDDED